MLLRQCDTRRAPEPTPLPAVPARLNAIHVVPACAGVDAAALSSGSAPRAARRVKRAGTALRAQPLRPPTPVSPRYSLPGHHEVAREAGTLLTAPCTSSAGGPTLAPPASSWDCRARHRRRPETRGGNGNSRAAVRSCRAQPPAKSPEHSLVHCFAQAGQASVSSAFGVSLRAGGRSG